MIEHMLRRYKPDSSESYDQALREVMQEIALAGLYRSNFFDWAAFYGGTALRIFHGLDRFSEDLDFSLLQADSLFSLENHLSAIEDEFRALGISVTVQTKRKTHQSAIESAFLKSDTHKHVLNLEGDFGRQRTTKRPVKIRFEVDTQPPPGFTTEENLLLQPFSFYVKCFSIPDLFAGKLHALLFRSWKNRVKGRDWYDFEWYVRNAHPVRLSHFTARASQSGDLSTDTTVTREQLLELISARLAAVNFQQARDDVLPFIREGRTLDIWSEHYFSDLSKQIRVV